MTLTASRPSASLTADLLGFSEHHKRAPQRIAQEEIKKKKRRRSKRQLCGGTCLVDVRGRRSERADTGERPKKEPVGTSEVSNISFMYFIYILIY